MNIRSLVTTSALLLALSACKSTPDVPEQMDIYKDKEFAQLVEQFELSPSQFRYDHIFSAYLLTSQITRTLDSRVQFEQIEAQLSSGELSCQDVDWQSVTRANYWSIKPHIEASSCYEQMGNHVQSSIEDDVVEFILRGTLGSGDGKYYYSAYEISAFDEGLDIAELAGFEIIDWYGKLTTFGQGFYYVVLVNDPETNHQREIYFNNQRFIQSIYQIQYPFMGINNGWMTEFVKPFADQNHALMIAKADSEFRSDEYRKATSSYLSAIAQGSISANLELGKVCLKDRDNWMLEQCSDFILQAAEDGIIEAIILLAYLYERGIGVEQDSTISTELLDSVQFRMPNGRVWQEFATLYGRDIAGTSKDQIKVDYYVDKAIDAGNPVAQLHRIINSFKSKGKKANVMEQAAIEMEAFAEQYTHNPRVAYIMALFYWKGYKLNTDGFKRANKWLELAAEGNIPDAHFKLGLAYEYGYFDNQDSTKALYHYQDAAIRWHSKAQVKIGYFNERGIVVHRDFAIGNAWFLMCAQKGELVCYYNLGISFENGTGVQANHETAFGFYKTAAELGHARSQTNVGAMLLLGKGAEKDSTQGMEWLKKAAEQGESHGQFLLGKAYFEGVITQKDYAQSLPFFIDAANQDYARAQYYAGKQFAEGLGISPSPSEALTWWKRALKNGFVISDDELAAVCNQVPDCDMSTLTF